MFQHGLEHTEAEQCFGKQKILQDVLPDNRPHI